MAKAGDVVVIKSKKETVEGVLMPSSDEKMLMIKLSNGYNVGFAKKEVTVKVVKGKKENKGKKKGMVKAKKGLPTVAILHCGGTIASKVDYETGAVKAKFSPEELLEMFPELGKMVNLKSRLVANMMSENMRLAHYNLIAKEIEKEVKARVDGVIITHGTDTLHCTAAALAFVLGDLGVPVILVGAQRSSDRGSSDAFMNLKGAVQFIADSDFAGVAICMHGASGDGGAVILPACKTRKLHSSRRDAFKVVNGLEIAKVRDKIKMLSKDYVKKEKKDLKLKLFDEKLKIGLLKAHPQMFAEELKCYTGFDGLVLEGTGLGHFPIEKYDDKTKEHELIFKEIEKLVQKMPVVLTTQTLFGGVNMNVYSPGRRLIEIGVLGNGTDMLAEAALLKLAWLLSVIDSKKVADLWGKNLRGEISRKSLYVEDFLK